MKEQLLIKVLEMLLDGHSDKPETKSDSELPIKVGEAYLFRTVTHIEVGRVKGITGKFVKLESASWIADTGRYHDCLRDGTFSEVEPYPLYTCLNTDSLINFAPWPHALPTEQK